MYQPQLDALVAFASGERFKEELLRARAKYFESTGEIFEDDKSFEARMASFLDFYIFDWPLAEIGRTPAQLYFEQARDAGEEDRKVLAGLTRTRHSLWEVRKVGKQRLRLRDCFSGEDCEVFERRDPVGLGKGDLLEARLIPVDGMLLFSPAFCFHPREVKKPVLREIKRLKKEQGEFDTRAFVWSLSKRRLKYERYRNIAVEDIYAFDRKTI